MKLCFQFLFIILGLCNIANAQNFTWTKKITSQAYSYVNAMQTDDDGNVYVTGDFYRTATFGDQTVSSAGTQDIFIAKYNKNGKLLWLKKAGGADADYPIGTVLDSKGNLYITGIVSSTAFFGSGVIAKDPQTFMAKYDSSGNIHWVKKLSNDINYYYNGYYSYTNHFAINKKDEIYFTGVHIGDSVRFGGIKLDRTYNSTGTQSWTDNFTALIDTSGKVNWIKIIEKSAYSQGYLYHSTTTDKDNNFYKAGSFIQQIEIGKYKYFSTFNRQRPSGYIDYSGGGVFIECLDADGKVKWATFHSTSLNNNNYYLYNITSIKTDENKNVYIAGGFKDTIRFNQNTTLISTGGADAFIAKYDSTGKLIWVKQAGGDFDDVINDIVIKNDREICVVGNYFYQANFDNVSLNNDNGNNAFIALYDSSGTLISINQPNPLSGTATVNFANKDLAGDLYITGRFLGEIAFNHDTLLAEDYEQIFISKFGVCNAPPTLKASTATTICYGDSVVLSVDNFYNNYRWYNSGTEIKGAKTNKIIAKQSGTYRVVIDSGKCSGVSNPIAINVGKPANLGADKTLCLGESIILNPGEFTSYRWSDGSTGKTMFVNKSGKYYVSTTNTTGCESIDSVNVTILAPPKPEIIASPKNTICPGDTLTLRLTLPYATYQWYKNGQLMFGETNNSLKTTYAGEYSVKVKNFDNCTNADTFLIKNTQLSQPEILASGALSFCEGEDVTLGVSAGYNKYRWLRNDTIIPNQNTNILKAAKKGKYVALLDSNGCQVTSKPAYVNIYPKPILKMPDSVLVCNGEAADLDAGTGFTAYEWNTGDTTQKILVNTSGAYNVNVKNAFGCSANHTVEVIIKKPLANILLQNDTLFASPATQYQWFYEGTLINGATGNFYIPLFDGNYTVMIWDENGCNNQSEPKYYESNKWKDGEKLELKIYPNPTPNQLTIQFYFGPNIETDVFIELHDALGKKLLDKQAHFNSNFSQKINVDLSQVKEGVYFMNIRLNDFTTVRKVVKVKDK